MITLNLTKTFKLSLLQNERSKGKYKRKNFLLLYDKILKALKIPLLEISIEEENARRSIYLKLDKWLACTQKYQLEYEKQLASHRISLLKESGLSVEIYEKSFELYKDSEDFIQTVNAAFWFAQRHALMLRKPEKITSQQYFSYIHNELKYLESNSKEIEFFSSMIPPSSLVYILAKRVEDHVWRESQLNFADRLYFEISNPDQADQAHFRDIKDEITALYDSLDSPDRRKGIHILSRLNYEARAREEEDAKKAASSEDSSLARRDNSENSTAITKYLGEPNSSPAKQPSEKGSPQKEIDIASDIKLQVPNKFGSQKKNANELKLIVDPGPEIVRLIKSPQGSASKGARQLAGSTRLMNFLNLGTTNKDIFGDQFEIRMEEIAQRAETEEKETGTYSTDTAVEIYEYICSKSNGVFESDTGEGERGEESGF